MYCVCFIHFTKETVCLYVHISICDRDRKKEKEEIFFLISEKNLLFILFVVTFIYTLGFSQLSQ